jgi:hypothetical protein
LIYVLVSEYFHRLLIPQVSVLTTSYTSVPNRGKNMSDRISNSALFPNSFRMTNC